MHNRIRSIAIILLLIFAMLLLTSCWSRKELNEISIVSAVGVDIVGDNEFSVTFQIISPQEVAGMTATGGGSGGTPVTVFTQRAPTLMEAIRKSSTKVPRRIYTSHLELIVLGENLAKRGVWEVVDAIARDQKFRPDFNVFVAKDQTAETVLKVLTPLFRLPSDFVSGTIETTESVWGSEHQVNIYSMIETLTTPGKQLVLPGIKVKGEAEKGFSADNLKETETPAYLEMEDLAVFHKGKLKGWLNDRDSRGYYFTTPDLALEGTMIKVKCSEADYTNVDVYNIKPKMKVNVDGPVPVVTFKIDAVGSIAETACHDLNIESFTTIERLLSDVEKEMKFMVESVIERAKEMGTDIFGIQSYLQKRKPKFWKQFEKKVEVLVNEVEYKVEVDVRLRDTGKIINPVLREWSD